MEPEVNMCIKLAPFLNHISRYFLTGIAIISVTVAVMNTPLQAASQGKPVNNHVDEALVKELLVWIKKNSSYEAIPVTWILPQITFCECGDIIEYEGHSITIDESIKGLIDMQEYKIILVSPWNSANLRNVSTLLHELIHFVQYRSKTWNCPREPEWEAYQLQAKWLKEQGIDNNFNWAQILIDSSCTVRDVHP